MELYSIILDLKLKIVSVALLIVCTLYVFHILRSRKLKRSVHLQIKSMDKLYSDIKELTGENVKLDRQVKELSNKVARFTAFFKKMGCRQIRLNKKNYWLRKVNTDANTTVLKIHTEQTMPDSLASYKITIYKEHIQLEYFRYEATHYELAVYILNELFSTTGAKMIRLSQGFAIEKLHSLIGFQLLELKSENNYNYIQRCNVSTEYEKTDTLEN
jgi:hypothetical protein